MDSFLACSVLSWERMPISCNLHKLECFTSIQPLVFSNFSGYILLLLWFFIFLNHFLFMIDCLSADFITYILFILLSLIYFLCAHQFFRLYPAFIALFYFLNNFLFMIVFQSIVSLVFRSSFYLQCIFFVDIHSVAFCSCFPKMNMLI